MPLNTCQVYLRDLLDGVILPIELGTLEAFITPPNPNLDAGAGAYVWGSHWDEKRKALPRANHGNLATGGLKELVHQIDVWLVWFGATDDPQVDLQFPAIIDCVAGVLRNAPLVQAADHAHDPVTGQLSQILALGENLSCQYGPVRATADQRWFRYDAQFTVDVIEEIQA